jgi:hypothetical protein
MKSLSLRNVLKNCGQDGAVKLLPRLVSKGCGRLMGAEVSVAEDTEFVEDVPLGVGVPVFVVWSRGISCTVVAIWTSLMIVMALQ